MYARSRGFTLLEMVVLIVVIGVALVGVLLVFQNTVRASADPQVRKQAVAIAEGLLDEILLAAYDPLGASAAPRRNFDDVDDYAPYSTAGGMEDIDGVLIPGLEGYNADVDVAVAALGGVAEAKRITVTVTGPQGLVVRLEGWRTRYQP